jgi:hypothetical protein
VIFFEVFNIFKGNLRINSFGDLFNMIIENRFVKKAMAGMCEPHLLDILSSHYRTAMRKINIPRNSFCVANFAWVLQRILIELFLVLYEWKSHRMLHFI